MAQGVVARCYDLQDAAGGGCGKDYRLSGLSDITGAKVTSIEPLFHFEPGAKRPAKMSSDKTAALPPISYPELTRKMFAPHVDGIAFVIPKTGTYPCQLLYGEDDQTKDMLEGQYIGLVTHRWKPWTFPLPFPSPAVYREVWGTYWINGEPSQYFSMPFWTGSPPAIEKPIEDLPSDQLVLLRGAGAPKATIVIVNEVNKEVISDPKVIPASGKWEVRLSKNLSPGSNMIKAQMSYNDIYPTIPADSPVVEIIAKKNKTPEITQPPRDSHQNHSFPVSGIQGEVGATMRIYLDLGDVLVGTLLSVTGNAWNVPVNLPGNTPPGEVRLTAQQVRNGVPSDRSEYWPLKIKPPQPTKLTVQVDAQGKVTLGGDGHIGATFYLYVANNETPFHSFTVTTYPWSVFFPDWLPGTSLIVGRQSVPDGAGQPIYSDWTPESTTVVVPVPPPTLRVSVTTDGIPTFSGTGRNWSGQPDSTIEVTLGKTNTPFLPFATVLASLNWSSSTKSRLSPGTFMVSARQWFKGESSDWLTSIPMIVSAPPAVIEKVTPNGLFAKVVGQCWPGAVMTITFSDNPAPHPVTDTDKNGQWDFQRSTAFRPGRYTVTVTQTFGGQTSNPVSMPFEIAVSVLVITPPPGGQTDHLPVLQGTGGIDGFRISVFDYVTHELLGAALATGDAWLLLLKELGYRSYTVFAVQELDDLKSQPSTPVTFDVVLLAPRIDFPTTRTSVPRTFTVEGYARAGKEFDRAEVDVYLDGVPHRVYPHSGDGYFKQQFPRQVGPCVLNARQYFKDQESPLSEDVLVTVVPDKALIETPGIDEAVGQAAPICGFGYPEDDVVVALPGGTELGRAKVHEDGTWFCWIELPGTGTDLSLVTEQRKGEFHSGWSEARPLQRLAPPPTFIEPPEGNWEGATPRFAGGALAGPKVDVVAWYDSEDTHAKGLVTNGGRWAGISERDLPAGPGWERAVQVVGGKRSMPADSKRFEVAPPDEPPGQA